MLEKLTAVADLHGATNRLHWTWRGSEPDPVLRMIRRRRTYPANVDDGLELANLAEMFDIAQSTKAYVRRYVCLAHNMPADSGLFLADLKLFASYDAIEQEIDESESTHIQTILLEFSYFDPLTGQVNQLFQSNVICEIQRFYSHTAELIKETISLFQVDDPNTFIGQIDFLLDSNNGGINSLVWAIEGTPPITVIFDDRKVFSTTAIVDKREDFDRNEFVNQYTVLDKGLESGINYYYSIFKTETFGTDQVRHYTELDWRSYVMATGRKQMADLLYRSLPAMHQYYDETETHNAGNGQLRRYLSLFGAVLDQARSTAEGLSDLNDVHNVAIDRLPALARQIGWEPDLTLDALRLRSDILSAPEVYRTVGTVPNIRTMVNRITGWDSNVKEFVHNVFRTNAPETIRLWEIYERKLTLDGNIIELDQLTLRRVTRTNGFDGHPSTVVDADNNAWVVWHSDRTDSRDIWIVNADAEDASPVKTQLIDPAEDPSEPVINEYPTTLASGDRLWLCWDANRGTDRHSNADVWVSYTDRVTPEQKQVVPFTSYTNIQKLNLSQHLTADDRWPTIVMDSNLSLRVFWQSNRRGSTDIWMQVCLDPQGSPLQWELPHRVTTAHRHHTQPCAVSDGSRIWLFYVNELGDRTNLYCKVIPESMASEDIVDAPELEIVPITQGLQFDGAPSAVFWKGNIWVFWHSKCQVTSDGQNRESSRKRVQWKILGQAWTLNGGRPIAANEPFIVSEDVSGDKEPSVIVDNTSDALRILWRSQRRGRDYQSRSFEIGDPEMRVNMGTYNDRLHYSYDTRKQNENRYARDTVGVFLTPNAERPDLIDRSYRLMNGPLRNFMPVNVRPILALNPAVYDEYFSVDDSFTEDIRAVIEIYRGATDSLVDAVPQWVRMHSVELVKEAGVITDRKYLDHVANDKSYRSWHTGLQVQLP